MLLMNILHQTQLFDILLFDHEGSIFQAVADHLGNVIAVGYHLVVVITGQQAFVHAVIAPLNIIHLAGQYLFIVDHL